jgi:UDP-N-acetylglucosamine 1-carboxyvinyltransferase
MSSRTSIRLSYRHAGSVRLAQTDGDSVVTGRFSKIGFMHAGELSRLGARLRIDSNRVQISGPSRLTGAGVIASDLRA